MHTVTMADAVSIQRVANIKLHKELMEAIYNDDASELVDLIVWQEATAVEVEQANHMVRFCKEVGIEPTVEVVEAYLYDVGEEELLTALKDFNKKTNE